MRNCARVWPGRWRFFFHYLGLRRPWPKPADSFGNRPFPPYVMLWAMIVQALDLDQSCNGALARIQAHRGHGTVFAALDASFAWMRSAATTQLAASSHAASRSEEYQGPSSRSRTYFLKGFGITFDQRGYLEAYLGCRLSRLRARRLGLRFRRASGARRCSASHCVTGTATASPMAP